MEASGTSGMKPVLNAGLNCSILDGWWPEGFNGENGWAIGSGEELGDRKKQDKLDAEQLYATLENEVIPTFYGRDSSGVPREWCKMTREAMRSICAKFSSHRMLEEYVSDYYLPARGG
jgi:starch phosphorylase